MVVEIFESLGEDGGRKQRSEAANSVKKKKKRGGALAFAYSGCGVASPSLNFFFYQRGAHWFQ